MLSVGDPSQLTQLNNQSNKKSALKGPIFIVGHKIVKISILEINTPGFNCPYETLHLEIESSG